MDGRAFLDAARDLAAGPTEAHWRTAAGRAYYALLHEGRVALQHWGFSPPAGASLHSFVRWRFTYPADVALKKIGDSLDGLSHIRNQADYRLGHLLQFASRKRAQEAVADASDAISLLDQIETDPARRTAAIAAVAKAFPP